MIDLRRPGRRAPSLLLVVLLAALAVSLLPAATSAADWSRPRRVTAVDGTRMDSLHQLSAADGRLHLVYPRTGPGLTDDRVLYQTSTDGGADWKRPVPLFSATRALRNVIPNLALAAGHRTVAVAFRVGGPDGQQLFVRVSRDSGRTFSARRSLFSTRHHDGIGVPAIAVGGNGRLIAVAWTDRADGRVQLRLSRNGGTSFGEPRTAARTGLSIDCGEQVLDGLPSLVVSRSRLHVAWSNAPRGHCHAASIRVRSSGDQGRSWGRFRVITSRRTYGWPEIDAQGTTLLATVQSPTGGLVLARSDDEGRDWRDRLLRAPRGHNLSAADVIVADGGRATIAYVRERLRRSRLVATAVVSRYLADGLDPRRPKIIASEGRKMRMAANIAGTTRRLTVVYQSGTLSGGSRDLYSSRLR